MRRRWIAVLSCALMITLISGCGILPNLTTDDPPPPLKNTDPQTPYFTASEILSRTSGAMERMEGYKWQINGVQDISIKSDSSSFRKSFQREAEYISTQELHNKIDITVEMGKESERNHNELYLKNGVVYIKNNSNPWQKSNLDSVQSRVNSLEHDYINPNYIFTTFQQEANSIRVSIDRENYILTLTLNSDSKIRPFARAYTDNLKRENYITDSQITYKSMELSMYINKSDSIINKITQKLELDVPLYIPSKEEEYNLNSTVKQNQTIQFKGEVQEILMPTEVY